MRTSAAAPSSSSSSSPTEARRRRTGLVAALVLLAVAAVTYGPHLRSGGLYGDDWGNAADVRFEGYTAAVRTASNSLGGRPLLALLVPLPALLFGTSAPAQIAFGLLLAVAMAGALYVALRALDLEAPHALAIAALSLVFGPSDANRLWAVAALNNLAVVAFLMGFVVSLHAVRRSGRGAVGLHAVGLGLYLASVGTYEVAGVLILVAGAAYLRVAPRRRALTRWGVDVVVVGAALAASAAATRPVRHVASLGERLDDLPHQLRDAFAVFVAYLSPGAIPGLVVAAAALLVVAALVLRRPAAGSEADQELRRWLVRAAVAGGALACAIVPLTGSSLTMGSVGLNNRANVATGPCLVALAYCLVAAGAVAVGHAARPGDWRRLSQFVLAVGVLGLGATSWVRVSGDVGDWGRAADDETALLGVVDELTAGRLAAGTVVYTHGHDGEAAPGVPIFRKSWDLDGAFRLRHDDPLLGAYPLLEGTRLICDEGRLYPEDDRNEGFGPPAGAPYGSALVVDIAAREIVAVADRQTCLDLVPRLHLGTLSQK